MGLTPIAFMMAYTVGIFYALFGGANYALYTYLMAFHLSPEHTWWGRSVPDIRYLMIAAVIAVVTTAGRKDLYPGEGWMRQGGLRLFLMFNIWLWLVSFWALSSELHLTGCILYGKHLIISVIIYRLCKDDMDVLKNCFLVLVAGCGWFGWLTMGKSGRVEGVAGAIADANTLGMHSATGLMLASMMLLGFKGYYRWVPFACIPLIMNTVIQAGSRGAFLGLLASGLVAMFFCPKALKARFTMFGALGVVLFFMLAHEAFIERITELFSDVAEESDELDQSAGGRIEIAKAGWRMALDYPFGAGHRGHAILSPLYMDESLLTRGKGAGVEAARGAHNSFMAAIVEFGFIGVTLYILLYLWSAKELLTLRKFAARRNDVDVGVITAGLAAGITVSLVAGQFSNYVYAEFQFWLFAMVAALAVMRRRVEGAEERARREDRMAPASGPHALVA